MTNIDETTGLPKLPEDHFWRIEENRIQIMESGEWTEWGAPEPYYYEPDEKESREVIETVSIGVGRRVRIPNGNPPKEEHRYLTHISKYSKRYGKWGYKLSIGEYLLDGNPVTPDNILERCTEVLQEWEDEKKRKELYGDYPPKKL